MHKARSIQKLFVKIGVEEPNWPAQSLDLNPNEHLWGELERRLWARPNRPTSVPDLNNVLVPEWKQIPATMFQHLVEGLLRRVDAVVAAKGWPTPYCIAYFKNVLGPICSRGSGIAGRRYALYQVPFLLSMFFYLFFILVNRWKRWKMGWQSWSQYVLIYCYPAHT